MTYAQLMDLVSDQVTIQGALCEFEISEDENSATLLSAWINGQDWFRPTLAKLLGEHVITGVEGFALDCWCDDHPAPPYGARERSVFENTERRSA